MNASSRLRIIVLGYIVRGPLGGLAWHHLQYAMGLADLGHDVWFIEDSEDYASCYDPSQQTMGTDPGYGLRFAQLAFDRVGLGDRWAYHDTHAPCWLGPAAGRALDLCRSADVMLNVSGVNPVRPWLQDIPVRVMIDTDPAFTQIDFLSNSDKHQLAEAHNAFFTFGESFGQAGCLIPDDGRCWHPTRQPVSLRAWTVTPGPTDGLFTTVMLWDTYERREWKGRHFGMKAEEMEKVFDLPRRCGRRFELAMGGVNAPTDRLLGEGWRLRNPLEVTRDPWTYQEYIRGAKAEFSVAKHGFVSSASGWFSERSACYLASGRPVIVQDTGFSRHLPTGEGLLAFTSLDDAIACVEAVDASYLQHCHAAREIAEQHFDARTVLSDLLQTAFADIVHP